MKLSKNLSLAEVTKSNTAKRLNIDNTPDEWVQENLKAIAEHIFQPLREHFGKPIYVSSGYRSADLNVDGDVYGRVSNAEIFQYIRENLEFDQIIWEFGDDDNPDWVHVSYIYDGVNRGRCLKACRDDKGKTYYEVMFGKAL